MPGAEITVAQYESAMKYLYGSFAPKFLELYPANNDSQAQKSERRRSASEPALQSLLQTPVNTKKGKRKAEEVDGTPPDPKYGQHATFLLPESRRECPWRILFCM